MPKYKDGKRLEDIAEKIYFTLVQGDSTASVHRNIKLNSLDGQTEIDILVRHKIGTHDYLTVVECKDYNSIIQREKVNAFATKLTALRAAKGIMVTTRGYSRGARKVAERVGIDLLIADEAESFPLSSFHSVPIIVTKFQILNANQAFKIGSVVPKSIHLDRDKLLNGLDSKELFFRAFRAGRVVPISHFPGLQPMGSYNYVASLGEVFAGEAMYIYETSDLRTIVPEAYLLLQAKVSFHLGSIDEIKSALRLIDEEKNMQTVVFDLSDFKALDLKALPAYTSISDMPDHSKHEAIRVTLLDFTDLRTG